MTENKKIYHKLVDGFKTIYDLDFEIVKNEYNKTGGRGCEADEKRFMVHFGVDREFPKQFHKCVCGHKIQNNCYISKNNDYDSIIIIGNCCIKHFKNGNRRICTECNATHKNIKTSLCNLCKNKCKMCEKSFKTPLRNNKCFLCNKKTCIDCDELTKYPRCYYCYRKHENITFISVS